VRIRPETHYATSGELRIAYQAFGVGPALVWRERSTRLWRTTEFAAEWLACDWELFAATQAEAE
jgi:hypothetical protein